MNTTDDYIIIWLDSNLKQNHELISQFQSIETFTNVYQCTEFIQQIKTKKIFLIISDYFATIIESLEKQYQQIYAIYLFCDKQSKCDLKKCRGVFTEMKSLCSELKKDIRQLDNDSISISIIPSTANNLNELDPLFMYFQLFKENLLTIQFNHEMEIQQFVDYCRSKYKKHGEEMKTINNLEKNYQENNPIWWYTLDSFLYRMLNKALRGFDIDRLIKMGFFIQDLHEQIKNVI